MCESLKQKKHHPILWAIVALLSVSLASPVAAKLPDFFGDSPIAEAAKKGDADAVGAALLDGASANAKAGDGTPVLVLAVGARSLAVVKLLIESGARTDDHARDDTTALTLGAANGEDDIVLFLLDHKADIDEPGALRETALIKAVRAHHVSTAKILVSRGANLDETDTAGNTALDIAKSNNWPELVTLLKPPAAKAK